MSQFWATVAKAASEGTAVSFPLNITFVKSGFARVILDEERRQTGDIELRHGSKVRRSATMSCPLGPSLVVWMLMSQLV